MTKKRITFVVIALLMAALVQTFFYTIVFVMLAVFLSRRYIDSRSKTPWTYRSVMALCVIGLWVTSPRIRWNTNDRIRLIYQDKEYNPQNMPVRHWFLNTLVPEPEVMNIGLPIVRYTGRILPHGWSQLLHLGTSLLDQFVYGQSIHQFKQPFRHLEYKGQFLASGFVSQAFNEIGEDTRSVYVISPKHWDKEKTYPVVVNLHGYLGNWQYYQGILLGLDDYVVISPATHNLKGAWNKQDIQDIVSHQLAFLETLGYKIDRRNVHLVGLSNGAYYGSSEAVRHFSNNFRSVTFNVGSNVSGKHHPHEMHIYGKDDAACPQYLKKYDEKRATNDYLYFPCCGHFLIAYHPAEIREWMQERWKAIER